MKKLILLTFAIATVLFGCKPKPKPLKVYEVTINMKALNLIGSGFQNENNVDTVMAVDDTTAYYRGALKFVARLRAERLTNNQVSTSNAYKVTDSLGQDIATKLNIKVKDSITARFTEL